MNKTKMILAGTGGAIGLAVLVMAFFTWRAFSSKTVAREGDFDEGTDGLETVVARAQALSRKSVYPCAESLRALESNRVALVDWRGEARKLVIRGDRVYPTTTPATFKAFLVSDAKRLAALPGSVQGVLVKPDFAFGPFKDYISGGKMPADSELALLQRKWDDVATIVEILASAGVAELRDVQFREIKDGGNEVETEKQKAKVRKTARKPSQPAQAVQPLSYAYVFSLTAKPAALVKTLNAFAVCERFIAVDGLSFARETDVLGEALGGSEKDGANAVGRRGRRGRRGTEAAHEKKEEESKNRVVTDPLQEAPLSVTLTLSVSDFRSLEDTKDKGEEEKK